MVFALRRLPASALALTSAGVLAASSLLLLAPAGAATAPATPESATAPVPVGLFGSADPTYDGVFRQSLSLLAFVAAGQTPPSDAVTWLLEQQCADGGFEPFRADVAVACTASDPVNYTGEDTNSSGLAAAALIAVGEAPAADRALAWALAAQNPDGGFPYYLGGASDANSTAMVLMATNAAALSPSSVINGSVSAAEFLASLQVGCEGVAANDDGGFAYQDYGVGLIANDTASAQATFALSGSPLTFVGGPVAPTVPRADCPPVAPPVAPTSAELGAGHLARLLDAYDGVVPQFDVNSSTRLPGTMAAGDTAWAILSLAAVGVGQAQLETAMAALVDATAAVAPTDLPTDLPTGVPTGLPTVIPTAGPALVHAASPSVDEPGILSLVALAWHASGGDPAETISLVERIAGTITTVAQPDPRSSEIAVLDSGPTDVVPVYKNDGALPPTGMSPLTPALAGGGAALVLLGAATLASTRRRGHRA